MGFGFYIKFRIFNKITKNAVFDIESSYAYNVKQFSLKIEIPEDYYNDDKYYGNFVFGTCAEYCRPDLYINDKFFVQVKDKTSKLIRDPELFAVDCFKYKEKIFYDRIIEELKVNYTLCVYLYNKTRINFEITKFGRKFKITLKDTDIGEFLYGYDNNIVEWIDNKNKPLVFY